MKDVDIWDLGAEAALEEKSLSALDAADAVVTTRYGGQRRKRRRQRHNQGGVL